MKGLQLAAQRGEAAAQFNLGILYDDGQAMQSNRTEAIKWLLRAARQGLPRAQSRLAEVYARGTDLPSDHINACAWFLLASKAPSGIHRYNAQSGYEAMSARLTPAEREAAHAIASECMPGSNTDTVARLAS